MKHILRYFACITCLAACLLFVSCGGSIFVSELSINGNEMSKQAFLTQIAERESYSGIGFTSEQFYNVKAQKLSSKECENSDNTHNYASITGCVMLSSLAYRTKFRFSVNAENYSSTAQGSDIAKSESSGQLTYVNGELYSKVKYKNYQKTDGAVTKKENVVYSCSNASDITNSLIDTTTIISLVENFDVNALITSLSVYSFDSEKYYKITDGYAFSFDGETKIQFAITYMEGSTRVKTLSLYVSSGQNNVDDEKTVIRVDINASTSKRISAPSNKDKYKMR